MAEITLWAKFAQRPVRVTGVVRIAVLWRKLTRNLAAGYRPERHYMRGPAPSGTSEIPVARVTAARAAQMADRGQTDGGSESGRSEAKP